MRVLALLAATREEVPALESRHRRICRHRNGRYRHSTALTLEDAHHRGGRIPGSTDYYLAMPRADHLSPIVATMVQAQTAEGEVGHFLEQLALYWSIPTLS